MSLWIWKVEQIVWEEPGIVPVCVFPKANEVWANYLGDKPRKQTWEMRIREGTEESKQRGHLWVCWPHRQKHSDLLWNEELETFVQVSSQDYPPGQQFYVTLLRSVVLSGPGSTLRQRDARSSSLCGSGLQKPPGVATQGCWGTHSLLRALCGPFSVLPGKGDSQRLTYIFKEGSCLQHNFLEVEADVSFCEQLQDFLQGFQAFTDDFGARQVVQASDDRF